MRLTLIFSASFNLKIDISARIRPGAHEGQYGIYANIIFLVDLFEYHVMFVKERLCLVEGPKTDASCRIRVRLWISHLRMLAQMAAKWLQM